MLVLAPGAVELPTLFLERAAPVSVGSRGLSNIVGIALCLSLLRLAIPIEEAIAESASKESSAKCFSHKMLCFVGPLQESRVLFTSLVHFSRKRGSDGKTNTIASGVRTARCYTIRRARYDINFPKFKKGGYIVRKVTVEPTYSKWQ